MKCLSCGCEIPPKADKCPDCGESVQKQKQLAASAGTSASSANPPMSAPEKDIRLTYDALGKEKEYATKKGPRIWNAVKLLIAVFIMLFFNRTSILYNLLYDVKVHQRFTAEEIDFQVLAFAAVFNKEVNRSFAHFKAHKSALAVVFTLARKAILTVEVTGVSNVQA